MIGFLLASAGSPAGHSAIAARLFSQSAHASRFFCKRQPMSYKPLTEPLACQALAAQPPPQK
jgi:hypothetical protein